MDQLSDTGEPAGAAEVAFDATGVPVISLTGEIDISNVDAVEATIGPTVTAVTRHVVFDLSQLEFLDSSGIALLLRAAATAGSVEIRHPSDTVRRVIEVTGLAGILRVAP
jgi:anti-anti-sigma factor